MVRRVAPFVAAVARAVRAFLPARIEPRDRGERAAARELRRAGWEVLWANLRFGHDEADLVCLDERGTPVLVEVKSSRGGAIAPELHVGPRKRAALRRIATRLARDRRFPFGGLVPRIDVVVVLLADQSTSADRIERHLRGAVGGLPPAPFTSGIGRARSR